MTNNEHSCYGCGKIDKSGYYSDVEKVTILGKTVEVCVSKRYTHGTPSKSCYKKALIKIYDERLCHICAKEERDYNSRFCSSCREKLDFAEKYRFDGEDPRKRMTEELVTEFLTAISYQYGSDEYGKWPFGKALGSNQAASIFFKAIKQLWADAKAVGYHRGFVEGSNLLKKLKSGEVSVNTFGEEIEVARQGLFEDRKVLEKHVGELVHLVIQEEEP